MSLFGGFSRGAKGALPHKEAIKVDCPSGEEFEKVWARVFQHGISGEFLGI
jgi:hypothetical protein